MQIRKEKRNLQVMCLSSGKGGVGKTLSTVHFAIRAAQLGKKVLLLDGDFGLSNVDVVLGLNARYNISSILNSAVSVHDVLIEGPRGIKIIPGGSGISKLADLSQVERISLFEKLAGFVGQFDLMLIDAGAGISPAVVHLNSLADWNVIVTNPEPHSITDAYAMVKVLKEKAAARSFYLLVNSCSSEDEAYKVFCRFSDTARRYLNVDVAYAGRVPVDPSLSRQVLLRKVGQEEFETSISSQAWSRAFESITQGHGALVSRNSERVWRELVWSGQDERRKNSEMHFELDVSKPRSQSKEATG